MGSGGMWKMGHGLAVTAGRERVRGNGMVRETPLMRAKRFIY